MAPAPTAAPTPLVEVADPERSDAPDETNDTALLNTAVATESGFLSGVLVPWLASLVALLLVALAAASALRRSGEVAVRAEDDVENYTIIDDQ
jgi:hypothetical protein